MHGHVRVGGPLRSLRLRAHEPTWMASLCALGETLRGARSQGASPSPSSIAPLSMLLGTKRCTLQPSWATRMDSSTPPLYVRRGTGVSGACVRAKGRRTCLCQGQAHSALLRVHSMLRNSAMVVAAGVQQ